MEDTKIDGSDYVKSLEQKLIDSERLAAVGQLAAGLAHEIRNPLTTMSGFIQIMQKNNDYSNAEKYIAVIGAELERMKGLVTDFVQLAKPSPPEKKPVVLSDFLDSVVGLMRTHATSKGVELISDYAILDKEMTINIDPVRIQQVIMNIVQNAVEAMEGMEGAIFVNCDYDTTNRKCCISVMDQGIGMDSEQLASILTPFFTTKETGTGLGLSVCYSIIESHSGVLAVFSTPGLGTRVDITLPF